MSRIDDFIKGAEGMFIAEQAMPVLPELTADRVGKIAASVNLIEYVVGPDVVEEAEAVVAAAQKTNDEASLRYAAVEGVEQAQHSLQRPEQQAPVPLTKKTVSNPLFPLNPDPLGSISQTEEGDMERRARQAVNDAHNAVEQARSGRV